VAARCCLGKIESKRRTSCRFRHDLPDRATHGLTPDHQLSDVLAPIGRSLMESKGDYATVQLTNRGPGDQVQSQHLIASVTFHD
jgi:hypothetical protein